MGRKVPCSLEITPFMLFLLLLDQFGYKYDSGNFLFANKVPHAERSKAGETASQLCNSPHLTLSRLYYLPFGRHSALFTLSITFNFILYDQGLLIVIFLLCGLYCVLHSLGNPLSITVTCMLERAQLPNSYSRLELVWGWMCTLQPGPCPPHCCLDLPSFMAIWPCQSDLSGECDA